MNWWSQRSVRWLLLIAWMGLIYYFSDQANSNRVTEEIFGAFNYFVRKGAHMTEYAILFWLAFWVQSSLAADACSECVLDAKKNSALRFLLPFLLSVFYAMSDEWHQSFVPGRSALFSDVLIDSCGAGIAALISFLWCRKRN